jgi:hypothetical protein
LWLERQRNGEKINHMMRHDHQSFLHKLENEIKVNKEVVRLVLFGSQNVNEDWAKMV